MRAAGEEIAPYDCTVEEICVASVEEAGLLVDSVVAVVAITPAETEVASAEATANTMGVLITASAMDNTEKIQDKRQKAKM